MVTWGYFILRTPHIVQTLCSNRGRSRQNWLNRIKNIQKQRGRFIRSSEICGSLGPKFWLLNGRPHGWRGESSTPRSVRRRTRLSCSSWWARATPEPIPLFSCDFAFRHDLAEAPDRERDVSTGYRNLVSSTWTAWKRRLVWNQPLHQTFSEGWRCHRHRWKWSTGTSRATDKPRGCACSTKLVGWQI